MRARPGALVAALVLVLAGGANADAATRILAVGDFGVGGERERRTGEAMRRYEARYGATLLVTLGDNDYTRSPSAFRRNWRGAFGWLGDAGVRVAGTLGNHDYEVEKGRYELETLGMPAPYYTRRAGDVELFLLDSNAIDDAQTAWLRRRLRASTARWKIAAFHHPPYSCGFHAGNETVVARWLPLFERFGVDLVLSGHEHSYQRFARRGIAYVVHGGGGAPLYPPLPCPRRYPERQFARLGYGFLAILAGEERLRVTALDLSGRRVERVVVGAG
jgi:3',5'-cyclic AMP phosphodiesterase CpdA